MKQIKNKGFTLVELIVVITILAILGTIAFISLQGYSKTARNSARTSDIKNTENVLEFFVLKTGKYPLVGNASDVTASGGTVVLWQAGDMDAEVQRQVERLSKLPLDPKTGETMKYSTTNNRKEYELKYDFELAQNSITNTSYADSTSPYVKGNYNGLFLLADNNTYYSVPGLHTSTNVLDTAVNFELNDKIVNYQVSPLTNSGVTIISANIKDNYLNFGLALKNAYSGSTDLNDGVYALLKNIDVTNTGALSAISENLVGGGTPGVIVENINTEVSGWVGDGTVLSPYVFTNSLGNEIYPINCNSFLSGSTYTENNGPWNGATFLDGMYTIDPDGEGGNLEFSATCGMTTDGGGWTLALAPGITAYSDPLQLQGYISDNIGSLIVKDEVITSLRTYKRFIKNTSYKGVAQSGDARFGQAKLQWGDAWQGNDWGNNKTLYQNFFTSHADTISAGCTASNSWKCNTVYEVHRSIRADDGSKYVALAGSYYGAANIYCGGIRITDEVYAPGCVSSHTFSTQGSEGFTQTSYRAYMNDEIVKKWIK